MKLLLITSLVLASLVGNTQDSITGVLIRDAIYSRRDAESIYYIDSSITFNEKFSRFAKHGKVNGSTDPSKGVNTSMRFSKEELKKLDEESLRHHSILWPDSLLANSTRIRSDSLNGFLSYRTSANYLKERKDKWYYLFSKPIFMRGGTVAIFRLAEMIHPSAGNDLYFIYIKNGDLWSQKMVVWAGSW